MEKSTSSKPFNAYIRDQIRLICTRYLWAPLSKEAEDEIVEYAKEVCTIGDLDASTKSELFYMITDYLQNHSKVFGVAYTSYGDLVITIQEPRDFIQAQLEKFLNQNNELDEIDSCHTIDF